MIGSKKRNDNLREFWEMQLNIDYAVEFEYYKKLFGNRYDPQIVSKKYNSSAKYVTYKEWRKGIKEQIKNLNREQLKEYSRYLGQEVREFESIFTLSQTLLVPFMIPSLTVYVVTNPHKPFIYREGGDLL